jgi:hypothetical protein
MVAVWHPRSVNAAHGAPTQPYVRHAFFFRDASTKVTANEGIAQEIADAKTIQQAIRARKRASKTLVAEFPFD